MLWMEGSYYYKISTVCTVLQHLRMQLRDLWIIRLRQHW